MKIKKLLLATALALGVSNAANAAPILSDLTTADYITVGALDWAWAGPIASQYWGGNYNELFQAGLHAGWREATDLEWADRPNYVDFGGKCASRYWNSRFTHCDAGNPFAQHWEAGSTGNWYEMLYVRGDSGNVPEPATLALLGLGLFGLGVARRRKS